MVLIITNIYQEDPKMRTNDSLQEIKETLENIRTKLYPDVDGNIIEKIVDLQFQNQEKDRRVAGRAETQSLIKSYIASKV